MPHASQDSRYLDATGIAIARTQAQYILSAMLGNPEEAATQSNQAQTEFINSIGKFGGVVLKLLRVVVPV